MVMLITDATSELNERELRMSNALVLPTYLQFTDKVYLYQELSFEEISNRIIRHGEIPRIVTPATGDFEKAYAEAIEGGHQIFSFHPSARIYTSFQHAAEARQRVDVQNIHLVDMEAESYLTGAGILRATRLLEEGKAISEILQELADLKAQMFSRFTLLHAQNRGFFGNIINKLADNREISAYQQGKVTVINNANGLSGALISIIKDLVAHLGRRNIVERVTFVCTPYAEAAAQDLRQRFLAWGLYFKDDGIRVISPLLAPFNGQEGVGVLAEPMPGYQAPPTLNPLLLPDN